MTRSGKRGLNLERILIILMPLLRAGLEDSGTLTWDNTLKESVELKSGRVWNMFVL